MYTFIEIFEAVIQGVNVRPLFQCRQSPERIYPPRYVLTSISLCADKDGISFVDCPPQPYELICGQVDIRTIRFFPPYLEKSSVLISSNATTTSAAIGIE